MYKRQATHRTKKRSQWRDVWLRLCRNKLAMIAMVVVLLLVLVAIFADFVAPYPYARYTLMQKMCIRDRL